MYFITGSEEKFAEVRALIPTIEQLTIHLPEIQSVDPQEIIAAKLEAAQEHASGEYIVEDTGLYLECLNGFPGPLIKWFTEKIGIEGVAELATKYPNQRASAITWIGYSPRAGETFFFEGNVHGTIVLPRGGGFGWDAIFQPDGLDKTFGEISREEKSALSMRTMAVKKLLAYL